MNKQHSIQEIREKLNLIENPNDPYLQTCASDNRKGVLKLLERWHKNQLQREVQANKWREMTIFERDAIESGYNIIAGVDEVGRGPLAGPVVAAAVILPGDFMLLGLDDSKKIPLKKRELFFESIMSSAVSVGIGIVSPEIIDKINIYEASKKAMMHALEDLNPAPNYLLIDAMKLPVETPQLSLIKGDARSVSISAASIVAKVTRDRLMCEYDLKYPQYGFKKNMGYGTAEHLKALNELGPTPWHRLSFAPVKEAQNKLLNN